MRVWNNRLGGSCTGCGEYVASGEGCVVPGESDAQASGTVGGGGARGAPAARSQWHLWCRGCAERQGWQVPVGAEHFTVSVYGAGSLLLTQRRPLSFDRKERFLELQGEHAARWSPGAEGVIVPRDRAEGLLEAMGEMGMELAHKDERVRLFLLAAAERRVRDAEERKKPKATLEDVLAKRGLKLYPFQQVGVDWLRTKERALLADSPGLGKTPQTLLALPSPDPEAERESGRKLPAVMVVCPAVAKGVWEDMLPTWRPELRSTVLEGRGTFRWPESGEVVVLNYDILPDPADVSKAPPADMIMVADECHALKNKRSKRTARFRDLAERARDQGGKTWLLTGTPLDRHPEDLWSILQCAGLARESFGTWENFKSLYHCETVVHPCPTCKHVNEHSAKGGCSKRGCQCEVESNSHVEWGKPDPVVAEKFARVALRRLKKDVLPDLPGKTYQDHRVKLAAETKRTIERELPEGWEDALAEALETQHELSFATISTAREALAAAKIPAMLEIVESYEEQEELLVVFSCHSAPLHALRERPGWAVIDGSTKDRKAIADAFQAGQYKGIACNITAAGTALTLTAASHELFVDRHWNPGANLQAEDRCARIGQKCGVLVTRLCADHVLDERLNELLDKKALMIAESLGEAVDGAGSLERTAASAAQDGGPG